MKRYLYHTAGKALSVMLLCGLSALSAAADPLGWGPGESHEISVYFGGGLSTINYKLSEGKSHAGFGNTFGLGYTYFFSEFFGINTGFGFSLYNAEADVNDATAITNKYIKYYDPKNNREVDINLYSTLSAYTERQRAYMLTIPIMLQFPPAKRWYAKVGVKMGIPISTRYSTSATTLSNVGYYSDEDNKMPPFASKGVGTFATAKGEAQLKLTTSFMLSIEAGWKFPLPKEITLNAGIYCDYGLNDIGGGRTTYAAYDNPAMKPGNFMPSSVLTSLRPADNNGNSQLFTKRVVPLSVGLKGAVVLGGSSGKKASSRFYDNAQSKRHRPYNTPNRARRLLANIKNFFGGEEVTRTNNNYKTPGFD